MYSKKKGSSMTLEVNQEAPDSSLKAEKLASWMLADDQMNGLFRMQCSNVGALTLTIEFWASW